VGGEWPPAQPGHATGACTPRTPAPAAPREPTAAARRGATVHVRNVRPRSAWERPASSRSACHGRVSQARARVQQQVDRETFAALAVTEAELLSSQEMGPLQAPGCSCRKEGGPPRVRIPRRSTCQCPTARRSVHRLTRLGEDFPAVAELDPNPVLAFPDKCIAVDARVRVRRRPIVHAHMKSWQLLALGVTRRKPLHDRAVPRVTIGFQRRSLLSTEGGAP